MQRIRSVLAGLAVAALGAAFTVGAVTLAQEDGPDPFAEKASSQDRWIHEDIDRGYAQARETGKPLLVAFR